MQNAVLARFGDKLALVTGAGGGIGQAVCARLAGEGARIIAVDRTAEAAEAACRLVRGLGGSAEPLILDQRDPARVAEFADELAQRGREWIPDVVVCCAGVQTFEDAFVLPVDEWDFVSEVNSRGTFLLLQRLGALLREAARPAAIVTIASIQGRLGNPSYPHYAASKAAVISLTKSFARALAGDGIRVNSVAPGIVDTPLWEATDRALARIRNQQPGQPRAERVAAVPLGRAGTPEDVASAVAYLASDDASYVTGECLHVCGGDLMI